VFPVLVFLAAHKGQHIHSLVLLVLTVLFLLRDQWVSYLRSVGAEHGADVRANWSGKLRTAMSFPIVCAVYAYLEWSPPIPIGFVYAIEAAGLLINVISIAIYTRDYWPYVKASTAQEVG